MYAFALLCFMAQAQAAPQALSLGEALSQALQTSPRLEIARGGTAAAKADYRAAAAEGKPQLDVSLAGRLQGPDVSLSGPHGMSGTFQSDHTFEPKAELSIPLYTGGRVEASKRSAKREEKAALLREQAEAQRLVLDVTSAYLDTVEAREALELARNLRVLNQERLRTAKVRQTAGDAIPLEVSQVESDLAISVQKEIETEARTGQSGARLNSLLGRPVRQALVLEKVTPSAPQVIPANGSEKAKTLTPEELEALGMERPDLKALREDVKRAEAQVDLARAQRRPLVNFKANYLRRLPETLLGGFAWSLGASLIQTIFDGGRTRAKVEAARAELSKTKAGLTNEEREAQTQIESARLALEAAERRVDAEQQRLATARESVAVMETRFKAGGAAKIAVTEANTTLTRAQSDLLTAQFEAARARVELAYVAGLAVPEKVLAAK